MDIGKKIRSAIDAHYYNTQQEKPRSHLGFSVIGKECARYVWYSWRWFVIERHIGRMIRLFRRGHREEEIIIEHLTAIGAVLEPVDPATGKQWLATDFGGHFGGSSDGRISNLDSLGLPGKGLLECKTSNDKQFKVMVNKGVASAKLTHYIQMQFYMGYFGLPWALYIMVNKNDDDIYCEVIYYKPEVVLQYRNRAKDILEQQSPPPRISNVSSFYICKLCPAHDVCHHPAENTPPRNCRTCVQSEADIETGEWYCHFWRAPIPKEFAPQGCDNWSRRA